MIPKRLLVLGADNSCAGAAWEGRMSFLGAQNHWNFHPELSRGTALSRQDPQGSFSFPLLPFTFLFLLGRIFFCVCVAPVFISWSKPFFLPCVPGNVCWEPPDPALLPGSPSSAPRCHLGGITPGMLDCWNAFLKFVFHVEFAQNGKCGNSAHGRDF